MKKSIVGLALATGLSVLVPAAPAAANSRDVPLDFASTNTDPDIRFVWDGGFYADAGRFCVRVRNVDAVGYATITKENGKVVTFSASFNSPDCQKVAFSASYPAEAYGYGRDTGPGGDSGNTGYFNITRG